MKNKVQSLTLSQIEYLKKFRDQHIYNSKTQVIYNGQIPIAAYVLLNGRIDLKNSRDKIIKICHPPTLIGFNEICNNLPFKYTAEIQTGSIVLILDRSAALEIMQDLHLESINSSIVLDIVS